MKHLCLAVFLIFTTSGIATAEEYKAIFWNLESGESSATKIGNQMSAKGDIDFWGLSEVPNQAFLDQLEAAIEASTGAEYVAQLSDDGASDRLAILYRKDKFTAEPYGGTASIDSKPNHFFEVDSINVGQTIRPGFGIQLRTQKGQVFIVLVHHWKCCGGDSNFTRRHLQAIQLNSFAISTPTIPIISGGDYNIAINNGGTTRPAFNELTESIWEYKAPPQSVGTHKGGTILDAVFVANKIPGWESKTDILKRDGNAIATTSTFSDSNTDTDHRPLLLTVTANAEDTIEDLRDAIATTKRTLESLEALLARLEANQ